MSTGQGLMVLGLGNVLKGDDGLGFYAIRDLSRESWPREVSFLHRTQFQWDPLFFEGCRGLVIIDIMTHGNKPGTVYTFGHSELLQNMGFLRTPWIMEAISVPPMLGYFFPTSFVGLEPACTECNINLTLTLSQVYERFLQAARGEIRQVLQSLHPGAETGVQQAEPSVSAVR